MPVNEYLPWAVAVGANVEAAAAFAADTDRANGFQSGQARSSPANTLWRQHSVAIAAIAQMIVDQLAVDLHDDGDVANFKTKLIASIQGVGINAATAAEIWAAVTNIKAVSPAGLKAAMVAQPLTDASTIAWDMNSGFRAKVTLGGNRTLGQPTNLQEGAPGSLQIVQDGTGSRLLSYAACWDFRRIGVPVLSTGATKRDVLEYEVLDAVTPVIIVTALLAA